MMQQFTCQLAAARAAARDLGHAGYTQLSRRGAVQKPLVRQMAAADAEHVSEATKVAGGWFASFLKNKLQVVVAAGLGLALLNVVATTGVHVAYHRSVLDKLSNGVLPPPTPAAPLPREQLRAEVRQLLRPTEPTSFYGIVAGPRGAGKTTLVRAVCRELGDGVGYVDVSPATEDFGGDLGEAFNFTLEKQAGLFNVVSQAVLGGKVELGGVKLGSLRRAAEALRTAAGEYRQKHGKPFVLVIDSVDRLYVAQKEALHALLGYAEEWAQDGTITTVFLASEWRTLKALLGAHPSQSRAGVPLWVGDLSDEEATQYLAHLGVGTAVALQCVELLGGSLLLLDRAAGMCSGGAAFLAIRERLMDLMAVDFEQAGLRDDGEAEGGASVAAAMVESGDNALSVAEWHKRVASGEARERQLASGVLRLEGRRVVLASRLAQAYAAEVWQERHARAERK